jgi:membrane associated rhomboid family serine protease
LSASTYGAYDVGVLPVGDFIRTRTTPYVNWTLIAINVGVFLYMFATQSTEAALPGESEADRFLRDWGFTPACVADYFGFNSGVDPRDLTSVCPGNGREPLQIITSMFLHAGLAHIVGNMFFLWIFGDNVEDRMGHARYLAFYLLCGLAASAAQAVMAVDTLVPAVGASGAIAGVLAGYLVLHPTAMVQVIVLPLFFWPFYLPAAVLIGFWFLMQLFAGFAELGQATAGSGVAWWAHIGGFLAGALLVWFFRRPRRSQRVFAGGF